MLDAKCYGKIKKGSPTMAQDTGAALVAFYHSLYAEKKSWWKRWFGKR